VYIDKLKEELKSIEDKNQIIIELFAGSYSFEVKE
jgi:hypothetical protein